eukprot:scaffold42270_cov30-Tisochrysis_lutea.AAC.2
MRSCGSPDSSQRARTAASAATASTTRPFRSSVKPCAHSGLAAAPERTPPRPAARRLRASAMAANVCAASLAVSASCAAASSCASNGSRLDASCERRSRRRAATSISNASKRRAPSIAPIAARSAALANEIRGDEAHPGGGRPSLSSSQLKRSHSSELSGTAPGRAPAADVLVSGARSNTGKSLAVHNMRASSSSQSTAGPPTRRKMDAHGIPRAVASASSAGMCKSSEMACARSARALLPLQPFDPLAPSGRSRTSKAAVAAGKAAPSGADITPEIKQPAPTLVLCRRKQCSAAEPSPTLLVPPSQQHMTAAPDDTHAETRASGEVLRLAGSW